MCRVEVSEFTLQLRQTIVDDEIIGSSQSRLRKSRVIVHNIQDGSSQKSGLLILPESCFFFIGCVCHDDGNQCHDIFYFYILVPVIIPAAFYKINGIRIDEVDQVQDFHIIAVFFTHCCKHSIDLALWVRHHERFIGFEILVKVVHYLRGCLSGTGSTTDIFMSVEEQVLAGGKDQPSVGIFSKDHAIRIFDGIHVQCVLLIFGFHESTSTHGSFFGYLEIPFIIVEVIFHIREQNEDDDIQQQEYSKGQGKHGNCMP